MYFDAKSLVCVLLTQEANKCKTELQYWRSKSPALNNIYGQNNAIQSEDMQQFVILQPAAIVEDIITINDAEKQVVQTNDISIDLTTTTTTTTSVDNEQPPQQINNECGLENNDLLTKLLSEATSVISSVGSPKSVAGGKRKLLDLDQQASTSSGTLKKARRVQNKGKCLRSK